MVLACIYISGMHAGPAVTTHPAAFSTLPAIEIPSFIFPMMVSQYLLIRGALGIDIEVGNRRAEGSPSNYFRAEDRIRQNIITKLG
jgi:hypothetical protein